MFFEKNKNLLIATVGVSVLWLILYYVLIAPNWQVAHDNEETAQTKRKAWEESTNADEERKEAKKANRTNDFKVRKAAEADLNRASEQIEIKSKELRKIEFGTKESLRPFSVAAVGKNGDTHNLLNEKLKQIKKIITAIALP